MSFDESLKQNKALPLIKKNNRKQVDKTFIKVNDQDMIPPNPSPTKTPLPPFIIIFKKFPSPTLI